MESFSDWQAAAAPLYEKKNLSLKHGLFGEMALDSLGVKNSCKMPTPMIGENRFFNVNSFTKKNFDSEFLNNMQAGVWLEESWPEELDGHSLFLYFKASPQMTSLKKALLDSEKGKSLDLGIDPYSLGLWKSTIYKSQVGPEIIEKALEKKGQVFRVTTQAYSLAGASVVQQLSIVLSSLVQLIENYRGQLQPSQIMQATSIEVALHPNVFMGLGQLQALQMLTARLAEIYQCDVSLPIYVIPAARFLSRREPWNNILRFTSIAATARMGGAQGIINLSFDLFSKRPTGERTSRNISEVLERESHLGRVSHPGYGSYSLNQIVKNNCEKSWQLFQEIEKKEGLLSTLRSGWLHDLINEEALIQERNFSSGKIEVVGANEFPLLNSLSEKYPLPKEEDCLTAETWWETRYTENGAEDLCDVARLIPKTLSSLTEKWQFKGDKLSDEKTQRVSVVTYIEPGMEKSDKVKLCRQILSLGGLQMQTTGDVRSSSIALIVAADPEGEFARRVMNDLDQENDGLKLWAGERLLAGFDGFVGRSANSEELFAKIYDRLGRPS